MNNSNSIKDFSHVGIGRIITIAFQALLSKQQFTARECSTWRARIFPSTPQRFSDKPGTTH